MKRVVTFLIVFSVGLLTGSLLAQSPQSTSESFSWHGELVSLDESTKTITVKSMVIGDQAPTDFGRLKAGDRVMLTWSAHDKYAIAIRAAVPLSDAKQSERFTFPVDFVSFDAANRYATFKVQVPENTIAKLKSIKLGDWITATSPNGPSSHTQPIVMIRHYNDPSTSN